MTENEWTVKSILQWIEGYLRDHGDENPRLAAQWLVAEALGVERIRLFMDMDRPLSAEERTVLRDYTRRRGNGEPLQYITGEAPFRHIVVKVSPGVLIPRPETEVLVSEALSLLPAQDKPQDALDAEVLRRFKDALEEEGDSLGESLGEAFAEEEAPAPEPFAPLIADIGTGSGCIACALASEYPSARIIATDIEPKACALATENVEALDLDGRVSILEGDLGTPIEEELRGSFDLIVSNPPYIPTEVLAHLPREVGDFEPSLALDGGPDGLDVFRRLLAFCQEALRPGGAFAFELHETCLETAAAEAVAAGFTELTIVQDLAAKPRILTGRLPGKAEVNS